MPFFLAVLTLTTTHCNLTQCHQQRFIAAPPRPTQNTFYTDRAAKYTCNSFVDWIHAAQAATTAPHSCCGFCRVTEPNVLCANAASELDFPSNIPLISHAACCHDPPPTPPSFTCCTLSTILTSQRPLVCFSLVLNVSPEDKRQGFLRSSCLPQKCCFCSLEYPAAV